MSKSELDGMTLDVCDYCRGCWYDRGELRTHLVRLMAADADQRHVHVHGRQGVGWTLHEEDMRYLKCPRCATVMTRRNAFRVSGVIVDVCGRHGVWADAGEASKIAAFVNAGGLEVTRDRQENDDE